jgi:ferric-dicitrate binding protein FerR (iron transport regulator)
MTKGLCNETFRFKSIEERQNRQDNRLEQIYACLKQIEIQTAMLPELKQEIKKNTEFRTQSKAIVGFIVLFAAVLGGAVLWLASKVQHVFK